MKIYCKNKYWSLNEDYNIDKILYLLVDRPNYIFIFFSRNDFVWRNSKNQYHRDYDLPSYIFHDGYTIWHKNDFRYKDK